MNSCPRCSAALSPPLYFCESCGTVLRPEAECEHHPDRTAEGVCVVCGMPLCNACLERTDGKTFCLPGGHRQFSSEWTAVCTSIALFEADAIVCNLQQNEIDARAFPAAFSAAPGSDCFARVFVKKHALDRARKILEHLGLDSESANSASSMEAPQSGIPYAKI